MPSHQMSPVGTPFSVTRATLVKMLLARRVAMALGLVLSLVPGATPKKPDSGLMARSWPVVVRLDPGDVVAYGPDLPTIEAGWGNEHGEVGFAAGGGESSGDVGLLGAALRVGGGFDADNKHVLSHPALVAGDVGGDAEGEALFAEERVATVAGAVGPNFAGFGEVDDVLGVIGGPGDILLAGREWGSDTVEAGDYALFVLVDFRVDGSTDAGHDAHVDYGVGGVGELDADLRHGGADWTHGEGHDVHGAAAHGAFEEGFQLLAHDEGVFPVVGGTGVVFGEGADVGAVFDAGYVIRGGAGVEAAGPERGVKGGEGAGFDEAILEPGVFGVGTVEPVDASGLAQVGHLFDPADEVAVGGWRGGGLRRSELGRHGVACP